MGLISENFETFCGKARSDSKLFLIFVSEIRKNMHVIRHIHTAASRVRILPDGGLKHAAAASAADGLLKSPPRILLI